jgi:hypothetical protein
MGSTITLNQNDVYQKNNGDKSLKPDFQYRKVVQLGPQTLSHVLNLQIMDQRNSIHYFGTSANQSEPMLFAGQSSGAA